MGHPADQVRGLQDLVDTYRILLLVRPYVVNLQSLAKIERYIRVEKPDAFPLVVVVHLELRQCEGLVVVEDEIVDQPIQVLHQDRLLQQENLRYLRK